jgi:hypothetical protein
MNIGRNDNNLRVIDVANILVNKIKGSTIGYLQNKENADDLVLDRKINDGVDKRDYQVNFDKAHNELKGFRAKCSVEEGIDRLLYDFKRFELNLAKFKQKDFYRLQQLDHLHKTDQINF